MTRIIVNTKGEAVSPLKDTSCLELTWHKSFNEVYCHHADYKTPKQEGIDYQHYAKVNVKIRSNYIEKGKVKSSSDKEIIRYLPFKEDEEIMVIPLHSPERLDAICENGWTTLKEGKRGVAKSFPLAIEITLPALDSLQHSFDFDNEKFPFTLFENYFESLKEGDKLETVIYF